MFGIHAIDEAEERYEISKISLKIEADKWGGGELVGRTIRH